MDTVPSSPEDKNTPLDSSEQVALKFLELARAEIAERIKFLDQISILWIGGVAAGFGWAYKEMQGPEGWKVICYLGAVVGFLAFAISWIRRHNEGMVNALANYQKIDLAKHFDRIAPGVELWECSKRLKDSDNKFPAMITSAIQAVLVIGPNIVMIAASTLRWADVRKDRLATMCFVAEILLTVGALTFTTLMIRERAEIRR